VDEVEEYPTIPYARALMLGGFLLFFTAGIASLYMVVRTADADRWVAHTLEVRRQADALLSDIQVAESSQRGYLLSNDSLYLAPYNGALRDARDSFAALDSLTADNAIQQTRLVALKPLVDAKFGELQNTVALAQSGEKDQALAQLKSDRGRQLMVAIAAHVSAISATELQLLHQRQATAEMLRNWMFAIVAFAIIAGLVLAGVLARSMFSALAAVQRRTVALRAEMKRRIETEETLRQTQKMEVVGRLAGGIAHDFNNLLTIILGNLEMMRRRIDAAKPDQMVGELVQRLARPLAFAVQGGQSAAQLTQRLLAFSRKQPLAPVVLDLNRLTSGMSELLRHTLGETLELEVILAGGLWPTLADPSQIESAILNLCVNARDAMPNGGKLTLETANIFLDDIYVQQFGDLTAGQYVLLSVTDTGAGIPPDVLSQVFEPFFTTRPHGEGSGLGLAMVHGFVKQSGGHVRIYSEVGQGTTVKIYLPRAQGQEVSAVPLARSVDTTHLPRAAAEEIVLVVEDNEAVRDYASGLLAELGYRVLEASNAAAALLILKSGADVDLLFTDVVMPGASGRELANEALAMRKDLAVLFTTGYTRNAIVHHGRLDADVHLLTKPYTQQQLALKLRELLDARQRSRAPA
jgi:signal transduction histidine kinase/CheY-like chemotaxis protein